MSKPIVALSTKEIYPFLKRALRTNKSVFFRPKFFDSLCPRFYIFGDEHACFRKISAANSLWGKEKSRVVDIFESVQINDKEQVTFIGTINFDHVRHFNSMELVMHQIRQRKDIIRVVYDW